MSTFDLFLQASWKVLVASLLIGALLPALFALGVRFLASGRSSVAVSSGGVSTAVSSEGARHGADGGPVGTVAGVVCFAVVVMAVALGLAYIVAAGQGEVLNFDHGYPMFVPKP